MGVAGPHVARQFLGVFHLFAYGPNVANMQNASFGVSSGVLLTGQIWPTQHTVGEFCVFACRPYMEARFQCVGELQPHCSLL